MFRLGASSIERAAAGGEFVAYTVFETPLGTSTVYVLQYLGDPKCERAPEHSLTAEYRLLCSGLVYRDAGGDWTKSEVARILLDEPLVLYAASRPIDDYPLELVLQLKVPNVEERSEFKSAGWVDSFHPDDEVAKDLAALLCLLCRRLITVAVKVSERYANYSHPVLGDGPLPLPLARTLRRVCWPRHPLTIITSFEGQRVESHNPPPKPVDGEQMTTLLLQLPRIAHASSIVASCRLYALALELIHERPDISYQLLISCVETMADAVLKGFQPTDEDKVKHQSGVHEAALSLGLKDEAARGLAIEACRKEH